MKETPKSLLRSEGSQPSPLPAIEIARKARLLPIQKVAQKLGVGVDDLELYGKLKAKISQDLYRRLEDKPFGKLVLVTAMTPRKPFSRSAPVVRMTGTSAASLIGAS